MGQCATVPMGCAAAAASGPCKACHRRVWLLWGDAGPLLSIPLPYQQLQLNNLCDDENRAGADFSLSHQTPGINTASDNIDCQWILASWLGRRTQM